MGTALARPERNISARIAPAPGAASVHRLVSRRRAVAAAVVHKTYTVSDVLHSKWVTGVPPDEVHGCAPARIGQCTRGCLGDAANGARAHATGSPPACLPLGIGLSFYLDEWNQLDPGTLVSGPGDRGRPLSEPLSVHDGEEGVVLGSELKAVLSARGCRTNGSGRRSTTF
jgi:hypothetical protein